MLPLYAAFANAPAYEGMWRAIASWRNWHVGVGEKGLSYNRWHLPSVQRLATRVVLFLIAPPMQTALFIWKREDPDGTFTC